MTPEQWDHMPWPARARYLRELTARERRILAAERVVPPERTHVSEVERRRRDLKSNAEWQAYRAKQMLRILPADPPEVIAERREVLERMPPLSPRRAPDLNNTTAGGDTA